MALEDIPLRAERQAELEKINRLIALSDEANGLMAKVNDKYLDGIAAIEEECRQREADYLAWREQAITAHNEKVEAENPAFKSRLDAIGQEQEAIEDSFNSALEWSRDEETDAFPLCALTGMIILDTDLVIEDDFTGMSVIRAAIFGRDPDDVELADAAE